MNLSSPDGSLKPPDEPGEQSKGGRSKRPDAANRLWFAYFVAVVVWVCCAYAHFGKWIDEGDFFFVGNVKDGVQTNDSVLFYAAGQMSRAAFGGKAFSLRLRDFPHKNRRNHQPSQDSPCGPSSISTSILFIPGSPSVI